MTKVRVVTVNERRVNLAREFINEVVAPAISKAYEAGESETTINLECIGVVTEIIQMILHAGYRVECGGDSPIIRVYWTMPVAVATTS